MISENQKNEGWFDPDRIKETRESELIVADSLNVELAYLQNTEGKGYRVIRNEEKFAFADLDVYEYDYIDVKQGRFAHHIEVEEKNYDFGKQTLPTGEVILLPPLNWTDWSFLARKIDNKKFKNLDIYVLCNKKPNDKIFWTSFGDIRQSCKKLSRIFDDPKEIYYRITIPKNCKNIEDIYCGFIFYGCKSLAEHISSYTFREKKS